MMSTYNCTVLNSLDTRSDNNNAKINPRSDKIPRGVGLASSSIPAMPL